MDANANPARSHPAVIASIVVASLAVTACAIVAIAYMMGWLAAREPLPAPPSAIAGPGQQAAGSAAAMALLPGESLVTMPEPPKSAVPPAQTRLAIAPRPAYDERPGYEERSETTRVRIAPGRADVCVNCGFVVSIASHGEFWDVVVRYDDGSSQTLRYPEMPRLRAGERVHLEDGRLLDERGR